MNINRTDIQKIWIDDEAIWIETKKGQIACEYIANYERFKNAQRKDLEDYHLSYYGIHWPNIDEDLSFDGFFLTSPSIKVSSSTFKK